MKKFLGIAVCVSLLLLLLSGCFKVPTPTPKVLVKNLGPQGDLRQPDVAYQVLDFSFLDVRSFSVKRSVLVEKLGASTRFTLRVDDRNWTLHANPLNAQIFEVNLPLELGMEQLLQATVRGEAPASRWPGREGDGIWLQSVVVLKEEEQFASHLYEIPTDPFISMRNAGLFVFDEQGNFLQPDFVKSSEGNFYTTADFLSARNAATDSSINGAFVFLQNMPNHAQLLQQIWPNQVQVVDDQIVVDPNPERYRLLKNLGAEGNLSEEPNVYNILDNRETLGVWSVAFRVSRLPEPEKAGGKWELQLDGQHFAFQPNPFDPDIQQTEVPGALAQNRDTLRRAFFQVPSRVHLTVTSAPAGRGELRLDDSPWGNPLQTDVFAGDTLTLEASLLSWDRFLGWYEGDTLLGTSTQLSFTPTAAATLTARIQPGVPGATLEWSHCLGGFQQEQVFTALQKADGNIVVAATTFSGDGDVSVAHGEQDLWVLELDAQGNLLWETSLGGSASEEWQAFQQAPDGGYYVVARSTSALGEIPAGWDEDILSALDFLWIVKLRPDGAVEWQKAFLQYPDGNGSLPVVLSDGGIGIWLVTVSADPGPEQNLYQRVSYVIKLAEDGNVAWKHIVEESALLPPRAAPVQREAAGATANPLLEMQDGGIAFVQLAEATSCLVKLDEWGNESWKTPLEGKQGQGAIRLLPSPDDTQLLLLACSDTTLEVQSHSMWGNTTWQRSFPCADGWFQVTNGATALLVATRPAASGAQISVSRLEYSGNIAWERTWDQEVVLWDERTIVSLQSVQSTAYHIQAWDDNGDLDLDAQVHVPDGTGLRFAYRPPEGGFLLAGNAQSGENPEFPTQQFGWIVKLDAAGQTQWEHHFPSAWENQQPVFPFTHPQSGNLLFVASTSDNYGILSENHGQRDIWIFALSHR